MKTFDTNVRVSALLRDLAAAQTSRPSRWGYRRAAEAVLALEEPLEALVQPDGTLRKIPNVGPSSTKVIMEALTHGAIADGRSALPNLELASLARTDKSVTRPSSLMCNVLDALSHPIADRSSTCGLQAAISRCTRNTAMAGRASRPWPRDAGRAATRTARSPTMVTVCRSPMAYRWPISDGNTPRSTTLNRGYKGRFRILKGIEANILADGSLDLKPRELQRLEVVVAAPHSKSPHE